MKLLEDPIQDNPKTFWSYVHLMKTENINIPPLKLDGKLHATDPAKATALNSQFKSALVSRILVTYQIKAPRHILASTILR